MVQEVKEFIEHNIDAIDNQDWREVFFAWYVYRKDYYFEDLMKTLEEAGIDIWEESHVARARLLKDIAQAVFYNRSQIHKITTFTQIGSELNSLLGFNGPELMTILDGAAKSAHLVRTKDGWSKA